MCDNSTAPHEAGFLKMQFVITMTTEQVKDLQREYNWNRQTERLTLSDIVRDIVARELSRLERIRTGIDAHAINNEMFDWTDAQPDPNPQPLDQ